ncbi:AmmeMemoRadiSam system protein B [Candidatus Uhrbacteria bacterium]|nr:AmmeMemoRadiSam system protein B [Candidatus Uhrbacteria bacterium]
MHRASVFLLALAIPLSHPFLFTGDELLIKKIVLGPPIYQHSSPYPRDVYAGILPHHAPLTFPLIASFYRDLARSGAGIDTFVVLGPDHFNRASDEIVLSDRAFETPFGILRNDARLGKKIIAAHIGRIDRAPFEKEHAIHSHTAFIKKYFPRARIVPILFHASASLQSAEALGVLLSKNNKKKIFLVGSIDFSHYRKATDARPIDERSARLLRTLDERNVQFIDADSPAALAALLRFVRAVPGVQFLDSHVYNTADFSSNSLSTTGYIIGVFGRP